MNEATDQLSTLLEGTDWPLLRRQKQFLLGLLNEAENTPSTDYEPLDGILHFLDAVQDKAEEDKRADLTAKLLDKLGPSPRFDNVPRTLLEAEARKKARKQAEEFIFGPKCPQCDGYMDPETGKCADSGCKMFLNKEDE